ncbi:hypothetical protein FKW77_001371 [Venturia effusa]|uniref:Uncharacterized protein n=1 Tax=Venturia effusa TaxID=50376 RepID=A0A517LPJ0_9PEZI|nr:hypothetical protein FKW77_001371 [Venturia effusa]
MALVALMHYGAVRQAASTLWCTKDWDSIIVNEAEQASNDDKWRLWISRPMRNIKDPAPTRCRTKNQAEIQGSSGSNFAERKSESSDPTKSEKLSYNTNQFMGQLKGRLSAFSPPPLDPITLAVSTSNSSPASILEAALIRCLTQPGMALQDNPYEADPVAVPEHQLVSPIHCHFRKPHVISKMGLAPALIVFLVILGSAFLVAMGYAVHIRFGTKDEDKKRLQPLVEQEEYMRSVRQRNFNWLRAYCRDHGIRRPPVASSYNESDASAWA